MLGGPGMGGAAGGQFWRGGGGGGGALELVWGDEDLPAVGGEDGVVEGGVQLAEREDVGGVVGLGVEAVVEGGQAEPLAAREGGAAAWYSWWSSSVEAKARAQTSWARDWRTANVASSAKARSAAARRGRVHQNCH